MLRVCSARVREPSPRVNRNESQGPVSSDASNATDRRSIRIRKRRVTAVVASNCDMKCQSADGSVTQILSGAMPRGPHDIHSGACSNAAFLGIGDDGDHIRIRRLSPRPAGWRAATPESIAKGKDLCRDGGASAVATTFYICLIGCSLKDIGSNLRTGRRVTAMTDAQFTRRLGTSDVADQLHQVQIVRQYYPRWK